MRIISVLLLLFLFSNCAYSIDTLHGYAEKDDTNTFRLQEEMFTGKVENLDRKDVIKMTVSQVLDSTLSIEGDEFFAEVTDEVLGDKGVIIPKGTIAHGRIAQIADPKRLGRSGWLELDFDYLITPEGREIPIEGKMTTKLHPVAETSKIVAQDVGYTLAGGAIGGITALNLFGLEAAVVSQGYTLAGGAAVGGAIGLGAALIRKGKDVLIAPGDQIRVKVNTSVSLPVYKESALMQHELFYPGLDIHISDIKHETDPFGEANTITLTVMISNMSDKTFSGLDMALVNDYNSIFRPSIFGDTKLIFRQIKPGDRFAGRVSFSVDNIDRKFWLTFYDKRKKTALTKISIDNAYRKVSDKTKKKNEKIRKKKTDFKKEQDLLEFD
ncbi:hypothetical protein J6P92_05190 [bacterium]|nr:hypothetical protein [bacterium]